MENRVEESDGAQNAKKPRSVDLQTLYDQNPKFPIVDEKQNQTGSLKRKYGRVDVDSGLEKKRGKKEILLSVLPSGKKIKKSLDEVYKGSSSSASSDLNKVESEPSQTDERASGFDVISLNLVNVIHQIPKRKRDLVRRKKADASNRLKQEGPLGSNVASDVNGGLKAKKDQDDENNGKPDQNGTFEDSFGVRLNKKGKRNKAINGDKEIRSSKIDSLPYLEKENLKARVSSSDPSLTNKAKRSRKKMKETGVARDAAGKGVKPMSKQFSRTRGNSLEDNEENLEENAAMMLSFRFDPSCTGFSSNSNCPDSHAAVHLGRHDASPEHNLQSKSDVASGDADVRILRPRDQCKRKGHVRKRRHFYEVLAKEVDAFWMVQKKIKVYWPLDQLWYFGEVIGYDPKKLLHHIKYDDREEEWIDLQNERFKLLLFPSEVPTKAGRRRSRVGGSHHVKVESSDMVQDEYPISSHMDSEPIISWLARSSGRAKSSSSGTSKKLKTSNQTGKSHPSSSIAAKGTASECIKTSNKSADDLLGNASPSLDNSYVGEVGRASAIERSSKSPVVYFRRRFRRKEHVKGDVSNGKFGCLNENQLVCSASPELVDKLGMPPQEHLVYHTVSDSVDSTEICDSSAGYMVGLELRHFGDDLVIVNLDVPVAIALVFFVLKVLHPSDQQRTDADEQLPETSLRLRFSFLENVMKQLVFAFYNFSQLEASRWVQLDHILHKYCFVSKRLPPSECTYNNIKALECQSIQRNMHSVSQKPSTRLALRSNRQPKIGARVEYGDSWVNRNGKWARPPPFALSFSAAPVIFFSLHLKLLMKRSVPCAKLSDGNSFSFPESGGIEHDDCCPGECNCSSSVHLCRTNFGVLSRENLASVGCEDAETLCKSSQQAEIPVANCLHNGESSKMKSKQRVSSAQPLCPKDNYPPPEGKTTYRPLNGITVEIPLFDPQERPSDDGVHGGHSSVLALKAVSRSSLHPSKVGSSLLDNLTHALSKGKPDLLCRGPKKPRTQVSYSLPLEGHDITMKSRTDHIKGFSHKRIRRASEKKDSDASRKHPRNMESLSCDVNLLVSTADIGWREEGARVVLEPVDDHEWQLAVKISKSTRYAYKVNQFLQSVTTNRYTHAMIWKGPKDWSLEFPDRSQWTLFKEMHEECYNRNFRAASVKNIPIPGVRLIEENDDHEVELPFVRPSTKYFRQLQTDVDIAMNPSHVLYDMDSDDELWISKIRSSGFENCGTWNISDALFENLMDKLEKFAYAKEQGCFTTDELEHLVDEDGPLEVIKMIYDHWVEKRRRKGMPLVRHLQPPHWEIYQQQVKKWESAMSKNYGTVSSGWHEKAIEKPPMFAFCLKPRGLEMLNNRGTKHRSQKKLHVSGHGNLVLGDPESYHSYGRRFYSGEEKILYHQGSLDSSSALFPLNNDGYERIHYPRLYRTKSRKIGTLLYPNDQQVYHPSHNQRSHSRRNGRQAWNTYQPEWPSPRYCHPERSPRFGVEHLDAADLDEFRLRDASSAAQHAVNMAKMKRVHAQRLLYRADLAIHKASVALMTADAIKASRETSVNDASSDG
ncbi:hypothetical protein V2J09_005247 [Rumex salicifolius]